MPPSLEQLRAARLHLQRHPVSLDGLVRDSVGLHSTDYGSPYFSAWARLPGFDASDLFRRLNQGLGLVRVNCMRNTVHVVHTQDLGLVSAATGASVSQTGRKSPGLKERSDAEIQAGIEALLRALEGGPKSNNELKEANPALAPDLRYWLLMVLGSGEVIRADAAHARSNRTRYALTRQLVPGYTPWEGTAAEARRQLILRAVAAFGPVTEADLAWWLPAPKGEVSRALASEGQNISILNHEGSKYFYPTALADVEAPARPTLGPWLLPYEDALLKGYQDRIWALAPGLREVIFPYNAAHWHPPDGVSPGPGPHKGVNVSGEARPSIWWGGQIVGRWEVVEGEVRSQLHAPLPEAARRAVAEELHRLQRFLSDALDPIS